MLLGVTMSFGGGMIWDMIRDVNLMRHHYPAVTITFNFNGVDVVVMPSIKITQYHTEEILQRVKDKVSAPYFIKGV